MIEEEDIARLLHQGDLVAAFELVMARLKAPTYHLALAFLADEAAAQDLSQEVFVKVWRALPGFRGQASISTWIYSITRNACLTELKRRRTRPTVSLEAPGVESMMEAKATEESFETPFGDGEGILRTLKDLSPQYQRVLRLFYLEQRPYQEIASLLGVPMGTVKTHLRRARLEMLKRLGRQRAGKAKPPQETIRI